MVQNRYMGTALKHHGDQLVKSSSLVNALQNVHDVAGDFVKGVVPEGTTMDNWNIDKILSDQALRGLGRRLRHAESSQIESSSRCV